jgi:hypothetical protein
MWNVMVYNGTNYNNIRDLSGSTEDTQTTVITRKTLTYIEILISVLHLW